mgnify:CR=1 FL=1
MVIAFLVFKTFSYAQYFGNEQTYLFQCNSSDNLHSYSEHTETLRFDSFTNNTEYYTYSKYIKEIYERGELIKFEYRLDSLFQVHYKVNMDSFILKDDTILLRDTSYLIFQTNREWKDRDTLTIQNPFNRSKAELDKHLVYIAYVDSTGSFFLLDSGPSEGLATDYFTWIDGIGFGNSGIDLFGQSGFEWGCRARGSCRDGKIVIGPQKFLGDLCTTESTRNLYANVEQRSSKANLKIYPNPTSRSFLIENAEGKELLITDSRGKLILNATITNNSSFSLDRGLYCITLQDGLSRITQKLVVY